MVLVGCFGFGKIIIFKLVLGLYLFIDGKILIDGYDIMVILLLFLWNKVGVVD